jgi:HK97 family phage prohead protease
MEISKVHWEAEGNNLRLSMPIAKVDIERRMVSGFATLDNIDRQGDIVPSEASVKAFETFRGNIREMHDDKKAVGKLVSFKEDSFYDQETGKFYKGVFVSAYVSKGAQDTWEKVLDGTLTGFSIGGSVKDYEDTYNKEMDKSVRIIKEYDLFELSLVDNPANQYANVISVEKGHAGGYLSKALIENVFWCSEDDIVQLSAGSLSDCPRCDKGMNNIGFVETNDAQKADVVKSILSTIKNDVKEVSKMENETTEAVAEETTETVVEETVETEVEKADDSEISKADVETNAEKEEEVEKAKDKSMHEEEDMKEKSMHEDEEEDMEKNSEEATVVNEELESTKALVDEIQSTFTMLADTIKALNEKVDELNKTVTGVRQDVDTVKNEFGKRVDAVEKDTAFRKSGDLGEIVQEPIFIEKAQRSLWGGRFLTKSDLFA